MPDVVMPRLSDSMEEGTILRWLVADGDEVTRGQEIAEIETDKATMPYEADTAGVLRIVAQEGETLSIGAVIATIGEGAPPAGGDGAAAQATAPAEQATSGASGDTAAAAPSPATGAAEPAAPPAAAPAAAPGGGEEGDGRAKASPVARRLARERGIDLQALTGSGPGGRIVRADVEAAAGAPPAAAAPAGAAATPPAPAQPAAAPAAAPAPATAPAPAATTTETGTAKGDVTVQELSRLQQTIARRMAESKATVPDFTLTTEVDMEGCVELRARLKDLAVQGQGVPSYNDMVVKACARALREFPRANGSYKDGHFELYSRVNVGVAVAAKDALIVPTVFDADQKSLGEIARDVRTFAQKVRDNEITPPELAGGTFTVSNLGMYGVSQFTAVINPPQAAILAVGAMEPRVVAHEGAPAVRHRMTITLSCDHRILYGADAAEFLAAIRRHLEQPLSLAL